MAQILKPSNLSLTWASGGDVLDPGNTKYATGWQVEIPPRQWFNYLDNRQDTAIAHFNQHGVAVWDATTEYQANKSYVQGSTNGTVYRCIQTHVNQNPETDVANTYWIIAFASAGDFYTKTETDNLYLTRSQNLADLPNASTARANLSVYSQAQTYTKAEVDARTTVASTLQSQTLTSNNVLLSPLRLAEAFKGGNQSLNIFGFQKLPGDLILQWVRSPSPVDGFSGSWPVTFPNEILHIGTSVEASNPSGGVVAVEKTSNSQFTLQIFGTVASGPWFANTFAIGY